MEYLQLYRWESYSFKNYPAFGTPKAKHRSRFLRMIQDLWGKIAKLLDGYRCVQVSARPKNNHVYEYVIVIVDRKNNLWKTVSLDEMAKMMNILSRLSIRPSSVEWDVVLNALFVAGMKLPRWAVPHLQKAMSRAMLHYLETCYREQPCSELRKILVLQAS